MSWMLIASILLLLLAPFLLSQNGGLTKQSNKAFTGYLLCLLALVGLCMDKGGLLGTVLFLSILSFTGMLTAFVNKTQKES